MKRLYGTLGLGLALAWGLVLLVTWTPTVWAQTADATSAHYVFLPLIWQGSDGPPPAEWATQTKGKSGIHLGNRNTDWQDSHAQYAFLAQIGRATTGSWPKAVTVLSDQLYDLQRLDALCQVSGARVKQVNHQDYALYQYLTEGVTHHQMTVVIRINPSPGNFSDFANPGITHALLVSETPAGGNYCDDTTYNQNDKIHLYRDILDISKEMQAIYRLNLTYNWSPTQFFFEPANEPNYEWYEKLRVEDKINNLDPRISNKQAWIDMDNYFAALYDLAKTGYPQLQVLAPPMAQKLYGEHFGLGTCNNWTVQIGVPRSGFDFMKKTYGYDFDADPFAQQPAKADGYSLHNYWREGQEAWDDSNGGVSLDFFVVIVMVAVRRLPRKANISPNIFLMPWPSPCAQAASRSSSPKRI